MPEVISKQYSLTQTVSVANELIKAAGPCKVWLWHGDLGAGKTTLIKAVCNQLGVSDTMTSPTFSIVNEYPSANGVIYHFDFYRLKNESEALDIGVEEYLDSGNYCFIEWPDRIESLWPHTYFNIRLSHQENETRLIEYYIHD